MNAELYTSLLLGLGHNLSIKEDEVNFSKHIIILIFLSIFALSTTRAGFLIEPYLGYSLGGSGDFKRNNINYDLSYSSPTLGGRVGYQFLGLMGGLDYSTQTFDMESDYTDSGNINRTAKDGVKKSQLGLFVGYDLPILLRVWFTYYLSSKIEGDDGNDGSTQAITSQDTFEDGGGQAIGVGFKGFPLISLNIEYRMLEYDKYTESRTSDPSYDDKLDAKEILFSVSLPLNL